MSTEHIIQVRESSTNNIVRVVLRDERKRRIVSFVKVGERHDPPVKGYDREVRDPLLVQTFGK